MVLIRRFKICWVFLMYERTFYQWRNIFICSLVLFPNCITTALSIAHGWMHLKSVCLNIKTIRSRMLWGPHQHAALKQNRTGWLDEDSWMSDHYFLEHKFQIYCTINCFLKKIDVCFLASCDTHHLHYSTLTIELADYKDLYRTS